MTRHAQIRSLYRTLHRAWGPQHWWPARTRFEVIVGAFLTQNTAWTNVERALRKLRQARVLSVAGIRRTPLPQLEQLVRSAGYFRQKARRLKAFVEHLDQHYGGSLQRMFARPSAELRDELLVLDGVGPETADSILLYAGNHEVFVVDAYTRRIFERHGIVPASATYEEIRELVEKALRDSHSERSEESAFVGRAGKASKFQSFKVSHHSGLAHRPPLMSRARRSPRAQVFNEMHGLIVVAGKQYCGKKIARCDECPLKKYLP